MPVDPLKFRDERRYTDRLKDARTKTGLNDAIKLGFGKLEGLPVVIGVQDFDFMGGSLGMAAGEAVIKGLETAAQKGTPFIMFAASGGARMQEGILSLMQLPRTTVAVEMLREARKPYIVVLTNPTTGGVTASYAMLGDVHIAEPGALIGFAGPRVIEQTIREKLPEGFQRAEYLKEHGMVDMVVHRHELRPTLARLCRRAVQGAATETVAAPAGAKRRRAAGSGSSRGGMTPRPMTPVDSILARLLALHPKRIDLSLERMRRVLERLGHPERRVPPVIHVAGTNGKGSTIAFLRAMLEAAGQERARLHLAQSGAHQRALPPRRDRAAACWCRTPSLPTRSPNASARMAMRRSRCSRSRPRQPSCCSRAIRPTCCCSKSASAGGSTPPT